MIYWYCCTVLALSWSIRVCTVLYCMFGYCPVFVYSMPVYARQISRHVLLFAFFPPPPLCGGRGDVNNSPQPNQGYLRLPLHAFTYMTANPNCC